MSKHTKGPWIACQHGDYGDYAGNSIVILGEGGDIRTAVVLGNDNEETQANARLIAASLDLLEALERILEEVPTDGLDEWETQARAAIAKAKGLL